MSLLAFERTITQLGTCDYLDDRQPAFQGLSADMVSALGLAYEERVNGTCLMMNMSQVDVLPRESVNRGPAAVWSIRRC